ncbi:putative ribonuclease H-like domain-containing protein, partial [Tanacetum coccineum]
VWILVDLPYGKKAISTKWVFRNKRDERGIDVKNKAGLVAQGFRQEEGIDYDEVFAHVARIMAIRLFLAFASYMGFTVYQMDVKSAYLYGTIGEEVYFHQPPGFIDPAHPNKVYKVVKALYGLHQAPRAWYETLSTFLLENGFRRGTTDKTLFIKKNKSDIMLVQMKQKPNGIFIIQDKYVADILRKFDFCSIRTATTLIEYNKPLVKDEYGVDVDVHVYRSMIGSLMYLTASRPDIMFAVCACARFQVTPKASHLHAVKRIFRYLKHQPKLNLGLWYPKDSPFELEAFSNSDYAGASLDRKSTTGGCQFLADHCCRDCYKKRLIDVLKIHTDSNVADLLNKGFDVTRSKLQLEDATGIHNLSNAKIYAGLATLGYVTEGAAMDQGEGSTQPAEPHHTPVDPISSTSQPPHLSSPPLSHHPSSPPHSPHQSPPHSPHQSPPFSPHQSPPFSPPHFSPPMSYEAPLSSQKKSKKVIVSASESEEPEDQGRIIQDIDDDPLVSLVKESMKKKSTDFVTPTKASGRLKKKKLGKRYRRRARSVAKNINIGLDAKEEINTGIKDVNTWLVTHKTKEQMRQEEARLEEAIKLQSQLDEEVAKQIHLDKMVAKRMAED